MGLLTILIIITTFLAVAIAGIYIFFKLRYTHWRERNIRHATPKFPFGDFAHYGSKTSINELYLERYKQFRDEKMFGMFTFYKPNLVINDPELIKRMLIQDSEFFQNHSVYSNENDDPLSASLFSLKGAHWKNIRAKLSPSFATGNLKAMFPIVSETGDVMQKILEDGLEKNHDIIDVKDITSRFAMDVITSCAFGIEANSLTDPNSTFHVMGKRIFKPALSALIKNTLAIVMPELAAFLKLVVTEKCVSDFFIRVFKETVEHRKDKNILKNDFMGLMIRLMDKGVKNDVDEKKEGIKTDGNELKLHQAAAQAFVFFVGGIETSSGTLQFSLYELAKNQSMQDELRQEILDSLEKTDGKMTYESVHELKFMGMVLDETLRMYPPAGILSRECNKDYVVPGTDMVLEKGATIIVPIYGLHMDPKYYPQPEKFIPERFSEEGKASHVKYTCLPFGLGPRQCIGRRFAIMQMKVALFTLLSNFRVEICEKTPKKIVIDKRTILMQPERTIYLRIKKLV